MSDVVRPRISHPNCNREPNECRITTHVQPVEAIHWQPVINGFGEIVNSNPNVTVTEHTCSVCGAKWNVSRTMQLNDQPQIETQQEPK